MTSIRVAIDQSGRITLPAELRSRLGIKPGDRLLIDVRRDHVLLMPEPADYAQHLAGLHAEIWDGVDPREYVRHEREGWPE